MADAQLTKVCRGCKLAKPITEFRKQLRGKYGVTSLCFPCDREYKKLHQRGRRLNEDVRIQGVEYSRRYRRTPEGKAKKRAYDKTEKCKSYSRAFKRTKSYRAYSRRYNRKYRTENKEMLRQKLNTPEGRAARNRSRRKWAEKARDQINNRKRIHYRRLVNGETSKGELTNKHVSTEEVVRLYAEGMTTLEISEIVDLSPHGVTYRLKREGVQLRQKCYSRNHICNDGHVVRSAMEKVVDDWLFAHGIPHDVEPQCPWPKRSTKPNYADFKVGDYYIELWGMQDVPYYRRKMEYKIAQYKKYGVKLIEIFPINVYTKDFSCLQPLLG